MRESTYGYWSKEVIKILEKSDSELLLTSICKPLKIANATMQNIIDKMLSKKLIKERREGNRRLISLK